MVLSAPKGIALSSGKHLQLTASQNLMFNAGDDADGQTQWDALQARTQALKTQVSWHSSSLGHAGYASNPIIGGIPG